MSKQHPKSQEEFFADLFDRSPPPVPPDRHPPREDLIRYHEGGQLPDYWRLPNGHPDWTLTDVSLHLLRCSSCQAVITQLREEELERTRERAPWPGAQWADRLFKPGTVRAHLKTLVMAVFALLLVNSLIVIWSNFNSGALPPPPGNPIPNEPISSGKGAGGGQLGEKSLKSTVSTPGPPSPAPGGPAVPFWDQWWSLAFLLAWSAIWLLHWMGTSLRELGRALRPAIWSLCLVARLITWGMLRHLQQAGFTPPLILPLQRRLLPETLSMKTSARDPHQWMSSAR